MRWYPQRRPRRADAWESGPHGKGPPRPVSRRRLFFEDLEDRRLMSVGATEFALSPSAVDFHQPTSPVKVTGLPVSAMARTPFQGVVATFTAGDPTAEAEDFQARINWGTGATEDGTVMANGHGGFDVSGSVLYGKEGTYPVTVTVLDARHHDANVATAATVPATVADAPSGPEADGPPGMTHVADLNGPPQVADAPLSARGATLAATAGQAVSGVVAHVVDTNPARAAGDFHASIAWGDGSSSAGTLAPDPSPPTAGASGAQFQVTGSHTYATPGTYDLRVQITDQGGATTSADGQATVAASPTSTPTSPPTTPTIPATPPGPATGTSPGGGLPAWFSSWRWFWAGWDRSKTWAARSNNPTPGGS